MLPLVMLLDNETRAAPSFGTSPGTRDHAGNCRPSLWRLG